MTITIHQIQIRNSDVNRANAGQSVPRIEAWQRMMLGARKWAAEYFDFYSPTYEVETDDLETAYELTNLWNNGHLVRALEGRGRSSSVGDLFELNGEFFIVDNFGFKKVEV